MTATFDMARLRTVFGDEVVHAADGRTTTLTHGFGAESFLKGHFPGFPVVPGVILLDGMILAMLHAFTHRTGRSGAEIRSVAVESAAFHRPILPGMNVAFVSRLDPVGDRISGKASVMVGDVRHARASLFLLNHDDAAPRRADTWRDHHDHDRHDHA